MSDWRSSIRQLLKENDDARRQPNVTYSDLVQLDIMRRTIHALGCSLYLQEGEE